MGICDILAYSM